MSEATLQIDITQRDARIRELELQIAEMRAKEDRDYSARQIAESRRKATRRTDLANVRHDLSRALALVTTLEQLAAGIAVPGRAQE